MVIGKQISPGRPGSPSRNFTKLDLGLKNHGNSRNNNSNSSDDIKLNEVFKQNNSVLTVDGKVMT